MFGVLKLSCASPGGPVWWDRRGFTRQPESPNVHISGFRPSKHHQNSTRRHPGRHRKSETVAGKGRKRAKFWAVRRRGVQWRQQHTQQQFNNTQHTTTTQNNNTTTTTTTTTPENFAKTLKHQNWPKLVWPKLAMTLQTPPPKFHERTNKRGRKE